MAATERVTASSRVDRDETDGRSSPRGGVADLGRAVPSLGFLCGAIVVLVCALLGTSELHDNSFFTHLATGRLLLDEGLGQLWGGMPDPYAFTSDAREWVVQSWFASVLYAGAEELAGAAGVRLLTAATCGALGAVAWRLTRPAVSLIPRVVLAGGVLMVGASTWTSRPFMFGLLCFALTVLAAEGGLDPRWLIPVGWLWVNTHGSFPLGVVALVLLVAGRRLDGEPADVEMRALRWSIGGIVLGGLANPVGPKLLWFPVAMLERNEILSNVKEWQSPSFDVLWTRIFLVVVMIGIVAIARRPSFRSVLPFVVFLAASLVAMRNINVALLAFLPGVAGAMAGLGSIDSAERRAGLRPLAAVLLVATPLLVVSASVPGDFDLRGYPTAALQTLEERGLTEGGARVATQDYVGNYLELAYGRDAAAFIDDRYELHSPELAEDYKALHRGRPEWSDVLDRWQIDVVVWERESALGALLLDSGQWRVIHDDTTAPAPDGFTAEEWSAAVEAKPFLVACRADFAPCFQTR